ncbi:hypothetical protein HRJ34_14365 [Rhizorhabdus wittichii]|uniref:Uncharacterized protein n=1 Tax=Rhizorhabdus wittichii TaxID=160791 RepID=A0A975CXF2_9SPHN|nr:hypothetical protein [Rhizorhabdus wittichii]QTH19565.1 hypothetical protein HRJ34_14365 [Rhizorhabdus wittichii]
MLSIPEVKFGYSANQSNVDANAMCDWLEACTLFDDQVVTKGDVVDLLMENQICPDTNQDLAHLIADEGWDEMDRRKRWGGVPDYVTMTGSRIESGRTWQDDPVRSFLVLLSILRIYPEWAKGHQAHGVQGDLFEKVVEQICPHLLPGWTTYRAGWSPDDTKNIPGIVAALCERIYTAGAADLDDWLLTAGNDGGLDLVCYREFPDQREAAPMFFLQCASGKNWRTKVSTPNPDLWQKLLNAAVRPSTGIAAPFVVDPKELKTAALIGQIVVFDRLRLLSAVQGGALQLEDELSAEVIAWMQPRVDALPRAA